MAQIMFSPSMSLSKSPGSISTRAHGFSSIKMHSRAKSLACHNMPSAAIVGEEGNSIEDLTIAHSERKINPNYGKPDYVPSVSKLNEAAMDEMDIKRIEELVAEIKGIFNSMEDGEISPSAYDTAWVARIPAIDGSAQPQFPQLLDWILHNQLSDGSWGEKSRFLACDRLLNTLSCLVTLTIWGVGNNQVKTGLNFLRRNGEGMVKEALGHHQPKGFEMVFPVLLNEARLLGLDLPYQLSVTKQISEKRDSQLRKVSVDELHRNPSTMLQSLEGMQDLVDWKNILNLQSRDGSFSGSPASTACVFMHSGDQKCLQFLTSLVKKFGDHVPGVYPVDIAERLRVVDCVERFGLERHFQKEIKQALDYVFKYWTDKGIGFGRESLVPDIDITATAFRLLRTFGYSVSSDVLTNIKGEAEELYKLSGNGNSAGVIPILSLYRCSQLNFLGENAMKEIDAFAKDYLAEFLQSNNFSQAKAVKKNLPQEVEYALSARWNRNMPMLMIRNQIELFNPDDLLLGKTLYELPNSSNDKYSELAKLNFNHIQATHRSEIQHIKSWYKDCKFSQLDFARHREATIYWTSSAAMVEPQYSECRLDLTKSGVLAGITDDLFDSYANLHQANLFYEAFVRWDPLQIEQLPEDMQIVFMGLYNTLIDISERVREVQGRDVLPYLRQQWAYTFSSFVKEREWIEGGYSPSLKEYRENAVVSVALGADTLTAIFSTGDVLPDHILQKLDFRGDFQRLINLTARLVNDLRTFRKERDRGQLASFVQCYLNEHPGRTEKDAYNYMEEVNEDALSELNYHFLMRADIPKSFRALLFNTARVMQVIYRNEDGFLNVAENIGDFIEKCLYQPVL